MALVRMHAFTDEKSVFYVLQTRLQRMLADRVQKTYCK